MIYRFTEVLNDLVNYFILGDILLLENWKQVNHLSDDLATEFTTNEEATINTDMNFSFEITSSAY